MLSFEEKVKIYKRFLKDNGVFKRTLDIHCKGTYKKPKIYRFPDCLKRTSTLGWIQDSDCFCTWCHTREGDLFWWALSLLWQEQCYLSGEYNIENKKHLSYIISFLNNINSFFNYYETSSPQNKTKALNICEKIRENKKKLEDKIKDKKTKEYGKEEFESTF
jgi:hypothetical protein